MKLSNLIFGVALLLVAACLALTITFRSNPDEGEETEFIEAIEARLALSEPVPLFLRPISLESGAAASAQATNRNL